MDYNLEQRESESLVGDYTAWEKGRNIFAILLSLALLGVVGYHTGTVSDQGQWPYIALAIFGGILLSDWFTGAIHWFCDTWGSVETPFIGRTFIRAFREHHVVPTAIADHPWWETNGESALLAVPIVGTMFFFPPEMGATLHISMWYVLLSFTLASILANQFHKWSHTAKPPGWVKALQSTGFFLSKKRHSLHHSVPFTDGYCITTGWMNPILDKLRFWRMLEWTIMRTTGHVPRADDVGLETALQICDQIGLSVPRRALERQQRA